MTLSELSSSDFNRMRRIWLAWALYDTAHHPKPRNVQQRHSEGGLFGEGHLRASRPPEGARVLQRQGRWPIRCQHEKRSHLVPVEVRDEIGWHRRSKDKAEAMECD